MHLDNSTKELFKKLLFSIKYSNALNVERKVLKAEAIKNKISTNRGFDISLGILEGLQLISIKKIGTAHVIEITDSGKEIAINLYGGINK